MKPKTRQIYFLCPGVTWDKPTSGGLLYNYMVIESLKGFYGEESVIPLDLIGDKEFEEKSWNMQRLVTNLQYLKFFLRHRPGEADLVLVDSRSNSLLLLPLLFLRFFSSVKIGVFVYHIYFHLSRRQGLPGLMEKTCERLFIRCASVIVTISKSTFHGIVHLLGQARADKIPIHIVPPGLQIDKIHPITRKHDKVKRQLNLLYVGTCEDSRKGLDYLIRAVAGFSGMDFTLFLVGKYDTTSPYHKHLCQLIDEHNVAHKVVFHGRVSDETLERMYQDADLFVFPSLWEGYGIVLAEAMAHGLPVVATDVSSIPEIVRQRKNGILVPPGNVEALADALLELLYDHELRQQMAEKSLEIAEQFLGWEEVGMLVTKYMEDVFPQTEPGRK